MPLCCCAANIKIADNSPSRGPAPNPNPISHHLIPILTRYLVVVINKMDDPTVEWSKERFDECVTKIRPFLRQQCGYAVKKEVKFIPISGLSGANVKEQV